MEEEIAEAEISLDEKEQESEGQTEDLPPNDSNSLTLTLYNYPSCLPKKDECYIDECYVPMDSLGISVFDKTDACYTYDHNSAIKHHPKHKQTKKKLKVEIK